MSNIVLVVAEADAAGNLRPASLEVVAAGRKLAASAGASVAALLMGSSLAAATSALATSGVDQVLVADDARLANLPTPALATVLAKIVSDRAPVTVLVPSTTAGIEYAPRVAAKLRLPIASDCIDLGYEDGAVVAVRPVLGGRVLTAVKLASGTPAILTMRQGSFDKAAGGGTAPVEQISVELADADLALKVIGVSAKESAGVGLDSAEVIVGGGRGLKEAANFRLVEELAGALGGAVAATRAITDAGWRPHNEQIGQTGRVVSPRLYIAVGISGAVQHVAGLQGAEHIVAINRDPDAPIFKIASFGIVGDLFEVVPALVAELKKAG